MLEIVCGVDIKMKGSGAKAGRVDRVGVYSNKEEVDGGLRHGDGSSPFSLQSFQGKWSPFQEPVVCV